VTSYTYDQDGNLTANSSGASFTYNAQNQTTSMTYGGTTLSGLTYSSVGQTERTAAGSNTYDNGPLGILATVIGGATTYVSRDAAGNLLGERSGNNHYYYLLDGNGSIVAVITGAGSIENRYGYDPYGKPTSKTETVSNPFQFDGGYLDTTGIYHFGSRYYSPVLGSWLQPDPGQLADGGYVFAASDPVNIIDTSGAQGTGFNYWFGLEDFFYAGAAVIGGVVLAGALVALAPSTGGLSLIGLPLAAGLVVGGVALGFYAYDETNES
jgi:RHS repeat-associated protein